MSHRVIASCWRRWGLPDHRQIDGVGGGDSLTSKVAIVGRAEPGMGADITYLFAQVAIDRAVVDTTPNCGNMLAAVAPFAIEHGLVAARVGDTSVMVYNINTKTVAEVIVQTPGGRVTYKGNLQIAGVPGTAAPIKIDFRNGAGSKTGKLLPTGAVRDVIDGVPVSCVDMTTPMLLIPPRRSARPGMRARPNSMPTRISWRAWNSCGRKLRAGWGWARPAARSFPSWR